MLRCLLPLGFLTCSSSALPHTSYSGMACSVPCFCCSSSLASPILRVASKTTANPSPHVSNLRPKSSQTKSHKEFTSQASLEEAVQSFSSFLKKRNTLRFFPGEIYSPLLELCASNKILSLGRQIHAQVIKYCDLSDSVFISTKLVFVYGNCASLLSAEKIFDRMRRRTVFTWNAMIGAYVSNGEPLKALELYRDMRLLGVPLDSFTFPCALKACGMLKLYSCGAEIHSLAIKLGFHSVVFVLNALVAMYAKCSDLEGASQLFFGMHRKGDVVSWNSLISAFSANGRFGEALTLFRELQDVGLGNNTYTFVAALQACEGSFFGKHGMEIHAAAIKSDQHLDVYVANALLSMYVRCNMIGKAAAIFRRLEEKDNVSWNTMLSGFVQTSLYDEALLLFHDMQNDGQKPDQVSILNLTAACGRSGSIRQGMKVHAYAIKNGLDSDLQVGNSIVDMYAKCNCVNFMGRVFHEMPKKDVISWTTVIAGYSQNNQHMDAFELFRKVQMEGMGVDAMMIGSILSSSIELECNSSVKELHGYIVRKGLFDTVLQNAVTDVYGECGNIVYAKRMFESMESKDVISWTSMISCYVHNGLPSEALDSFCRMKESNIEPDYVSLVSLLSAVASLSSLEKGQEIHGYLVRKGFTLAGPLASSLVDMYSHCGAIEDACRVFNRIKDKDLILWTSMINAYGMHGHGTAAVDLFNKIEAEKFLPDHITFLALLHACSHSGLVDDGRRFIRIMKCRYQLEPWPEHYACLVDLLARANNSEEAYQFVKSMQDKPTAEIWSALLGACRFHPKTEIAEIAAQKLLELDLENPGNYVLVSNVFAACGRWEDVEKVRMRMRGSGLKKNPGCSWIEVENKVHTFTARDKSHPESDKIYAVLAEVMEKLESEGGYVPQTSSVLHNVSEEEKVKMLYGHSERLAIAYGLLVTPAGTPIRVAKNLRICSDCHGFCKLVSKLFERKLVVRDSNRFHYFEGGSCSCGDFW